MQDMFREAQHRLTEATTEMLYQWFEDLLMATFDDDVMRRLADMLRTGSMPPNKAGLDPYRVLGLDKSVTDDDVKKRYRELLKKLHPDTAGVKGTEFLLHVLITAYGQIARERGWRK